ncbi:TetR/AcrR family transcriptional regulator [Bifidobacterium xylocopae]|uniref:HTH tetR-type domain-containing protein n=1 Tax=Bifidobacterium xylocopae TaxID=2493119 RepID=A0A366KEJ2_9BIFI|nr:TetR/AcrR family transcriptional regulator [Bifidobacterium xylocopae]RBP99533.1 hypothetical protein CRD59_03120 [Bifidobacterium xylocopae]
MPKIEEATLSEHRQRLLAHILDAAEAILKTGGRQALTMGAVSKRAGIARNSLYRYAANADRLADMVMERRLPSWEGALNSALDGLVDPRAIILAWSRTNMNQAREHGHGWLMDLFADSGDTHMRKRFLYGRGPEAGAAPDQSTGSTYSSAEPGGAGIAKLHFYHMVNDPLIQAWQRLLPGRVQTGVELTRGLVQSGMRLIDAQEASVSAKAPDTRERDQTIEEIAQDVQACVQAVVLALTEPRSGNITQAGYGQVE